MDPQDLPTDETGSDTTQETHMNNIAKTLDKTISSTNKSNDTIVLVCGSFFIMTDVREHLQMPEMPVDDI